MAGATAIPSTWTEEIWTRLVRDMRREADEYDALRILDDGLLAPEGQGEDAQRRIRMIVRGIPVDLVIYLNRSMGAVRTNAPNPDPEIARYDDVKAAPMTVIPRPYGPKHFVPLFAPASWKFDGRIWGSWAAHVVGEIDDKVAALPRPEVKEVLAGTAGPIFISTLLHQTWANRIGEALAKRREGEWKEGKGAQPGVAVGGDLFGCVAPDIRQEQDATFYVQYISGLTKVWTSPLSSREKKTCTGRRSRSRSWRVDRPGGQEAFLSRPTPDQLDPDSAPNLASTSTISGPVACARGKRCPARHATSPRLLDRPSWSAHKMLWHRHCSGVVYSRHFAPGLGPDG